MKDCVDWEAEHYKLVEYIKDQLKKAEGLIKVAENAGMSTFWNGHVDAFESILREMKKYESYMGEV